MCCRSVQSASGVGCCPKKANKFDQETKDNVRGFDRKLRGNLPGDFPFFTRFRICIIQYLIIQYYQNFSASLYHRFKAAKSILSLKLTPTCPSSPAGPPSGVHCEINIDDCNPFTDPVTNEPKCFNKGKCVDRVGGYHCTCPAGYVGERCEGDVNECLSNPCDPRGTHSCTQLTNNYRCECRTGYTGKQAVGVVIGQPFRVSSKDLFRILVHFWVFLEFLNEIFLCWFHLVFIYLCPLVGLTLSSTIEVGLK